MHELAGPYRSRKRSRVAVLAMAVAVTAGVIAAGGVLAAVVGSPKSGALQQLPEHVAYLPYTDYSIGTVFTDGLERLYPTDGPVTLIEVEWLGSQASGKVLGWRIAGPEREFNRQVSPGFPPTDPGFGPLTDAVGTEIVDAEMGHELLIGIKVVSDEYSVREGIRVTTEQDGVTYQDVLPGVLVFCGADLSVDACQARYEAAE
jgi:hypothetical protein